MIDLISNTAEKKKKTIIHLIFSLTVGGAENLVVDLVNNQQTTHNTYLIILNKFYDINVIKAVNKGVKKILINRKVGSKNIFKILKLNLWILKIKPDVIHCHNKEAIAILLINKSKSVLTVHDVKMDIGYFSRYKKIAAISKAVKDDIEIRSGYKLKAEIVYNGVDFSKIDIRKNYIINEKIKIVQVSRLMHEKKGQDILLNALRSLKEKNKVVNIELTLVGSGESILFLKGLINKYSLTEDVIFLESKDRSWVYNNLKSYDLLVQPSRYEGFGLTIIEAIAARIPVIASDLDGPKEILIDGQFGELFKSGNSEELANKIEKVFLAYQTNKVQEITEKAYNYAFANFSLHKMLLGYEGIYNSID